MQLQKLLEGMDYQVLQGDLTIETEAVIYDSRKAVKGGVFISMAGTVKDSHEFIPDVLARGVTALVVEREVKAPADITVIKVASGRIALARMSAAFFDYPAKKLVTIGITGTKGKTTTSHMIKSVLEQSGHKVGLIGTNGIIIAGQIYVSSNTTPESYQLHEYFYRMVEAGCTYLVMEVSSQGLKMHRVEGIEFDYGLFMNISPDHIGPLEHEDFDEYLYWKTQLFKRCKIGLLNCDDTHINGILKTHDYDCQAYTFGIDNEADFKAENISYLMEPGFVGVGFHLSGQREMDVKINIPGRFNVYNGLAAISLCQLLEIEEAAISAVLSEIIVDGRMEIVHSPTSEKPFTIIVDYAHNAVSMESLLSTLRMYQPKRLICVFGCGGNRSRLRRYDMGEIAGRLADLSIITADNSRFEKVGDIINDIKTGIHKTEGLYVEIPDRREAIRYGVETSRDGDILVIIGKGHENYQEVEGVRHHFLDKEEVLKAISEGVSDGGC